jgi:hypothetical protein
MIFHKPKYYILKQGSFSFLVLYSKYKMLHILTEVVTRIFFLIQYNNKYLFQTCTAKLYDTRK